MKLDDYILKTENGIVYPVFTFKEYNSKTEEYSELVIKKSAEEIYSEWLKNKDKPLEQPIDPKDILIAELSISLAESQAQGAQAIAELTEAIAMLQIPTV